MDILNNILERTGIDDVIALMLVTVSSFIWLTGGDIPDTLAVLTVTIVGFFFGKKYTERGVQTGVNAVNPPPAAPYIADPED